MAGRLYIVPTPVGNLEDMTFRAVKVLREADLILAEDTRTSAVLLKHYDIRGRLQSHHKYNEHQTVALIKEKLLAGLDVALVSDAGTPGISDPGFLLVRTCAEEGIEVQTGRGNADAGLLRVAVPPRQDPGTDGGRFRSRTALLRRPGNFQDPRGTPAGDPRRGGRVVP